MVPYAVTENDIPRWLYNDFLRMRAIVERLPQVSGTPISCHAVCWALVLTAPKGSRLQVRDGTAGICNHSWLVDKRVPTVILDMYPVAASPFIAYVDTLVTPLAGRYRERPLTYDGEVVRQVSLLVTHIQHMV